jgi:site-specific recombinase XerD
MSGALHAATAPLPGTMFEFLNFCRIEKGLSANSLEAYTLDLAKWSAYLGDSAEPAGAEGCVIISIIYISPASVNVPSPAI